MAQALLDHKKYATLLSTVLPQPITSEAQHKSALDVTSRLLKKGELMPEENTLLRLLSLVIADYERNRYADLSKKSTPMELLAFLMEENGLTQTDFSPIPQSRMSEILAGKRKISLTQAKVLANRFKVSPVLFL